MANQLAAARLAALRRAQQDPERAAEEPGRGERLLGFGRQVAQGIGYGASRAYEGARYYGPPVARGIGSAASSGFGAVRHYAPIVGTKSLAFFRSLRNAAAPYVGSAASGAGTGAQVLMWKGIAQAVKVPPALAGAYESVRSWGSDLDERRIAAAKAAWQSSVALREEQFSNIANAQERRLKASCRAAESLFNSDEFEREFTEPEHKFRKVILYLCLVYDIHLEDIDFTTASEDEIEAALQGFLAANPGKRADLELILQILDCLIPISEREAEEKERAAIAAERAYREDRNRRNRTHGRANRVRNNGHESRRRRNASRSRNRGRNRSRNAREERRRHNERRGRHSRNRREERRRHNERRGSRRSRRRHSRSRSESSRNSTEERGHGHHRAGRGRGNLFGREENW